MALANVCKIPVLSGAAGSAGGKGVDSTNTSDEAVASAVALAQHYGCVVAVSGAVDIITDGKDKAMVANGQEMLTKITAAGCSLSALCAAYCAVSETPFVGVVAAFAHFTVASDLAAALPEVAPRQCAIYFECALLPLLTCTSLIVASVRQVKGPGTLRVHLLDQLYLLSPEMLEKHMRLEVVAL